MVAYYNEFKPEAAHMLRQLIKDGNIAPGDVDERSITEVKSDDLKGYTQCHFFAGIGGWSVALRLAGWDDNRPVWTGSPPCQEHSTAGKQKGASGSRNLWPHFGRLIAESKPPTVFGEQVAAAIALGWLDEAFNDLEAQNYACAAPVLPACSVGKYHKRERLWFVANRNVPEQYTDSRRRSRDQIIEKGNDPSGRCTMGDTEHNGWNRGQVAGSDAASDGRTSQRKNSSEQSSGTSQSIDVGHSFQSRLEGHAGHEQEGCESRWNDTPSLRPISADDTLEWIECPDGKSRPVKPGIRLLAHGVQHRAPILHAFGNAIVPQVAAEFIKAFTHIQGDITI